MGQRSRGRGEGWNLPSRRPAALLRFHLLIDASARPPQLSRESPAREFALHALTFPGTPLLEFAPVETSPVARVPDLRKPSSINVVGIPLGRTRFFYVSSTRRRSGASDAPSEDLSAGISVSSFCAELIRFDAAITQIEASRCPAPTAKLRETF